jgi:hypothetical protein
MITEPPCSELRNIDSSASATKRHGHFGLSIIPWPIKPTGITFGSPMRRLYQGRHPTRFAHAANSRRYAARSVGGVSSSGGVGTSVALPITVGGAPTKTTTPRVPTLPRSTGVGVTTPRTTAATKVERIAALLTVDEKPV